MSKSRKINSYVMVTQGSFELAEGGDNEAKRYWKQLAIYGDFVDPRGGDKKMVIDRSLADKLVANYKSGVRGLIPVPLGHPKTDAELADSNRGELIDLEARDDGLYGLMEIRDPKTAEKIDRKLITDDSIAFDDDYQDKKTGKWVGPTLKHVGLVVNPYLKGMTQFQPALSDSAGAAVLFSDGQVNDKERELTVETVDVKNDRDFNVEVRFTNADGEQKVVVKAGEVVTVPTDQEESVKKQLADAVKPEAEGEALSEQQKKEKELADREVEIAKREAELSEKDANIAYEKLLSDGKIVPAQKEAFIALSSKGSTSVELSEGESKTVSALLSELFEAAPKGTYMSEEGVDGGDKNDDKDDVQLTDEDKAVAESFGNSPEEIAEYRKSQEGK